MLKRKGPKSRPAALKGGAAPAGELRFILADGRELLARQGEACGGLRIVIPEPLCGKRLLSCSGRFAPLSGIQRWRWYEAELEGDGQEPLWLCSSVQMLEQPGTAAPLWPETGGKS